MVARKMKMSAQMWKGTFTTATYGRRRYKVYVPSEYRPEKPAMLLVMLHGCMQTPDDFAFGTEMNTYAERHTFIVLYPSQSRLSNPARCWNWFQPEHQSRGLGEPADIVGMVEAVQQTYTIDPERIYVSGISAGASMAVILGATYPDVFAAIGVGSGMAYQAATSWAGALLAQSRGAGDPVLLGKLAYHAMGVYKRVVPVIVFHGTEDNAVAPVNADHVIAQWAATNQLAADSFQTVHISPRPTRTIPWAMFNGRSYTEYVYEDSNGHVVMKKYLISGMKHSWTGGARGGMFTDALGPKASELLLEFFFQHRMRGILLPPGQVVQPAAGERETVVGEVLTVEPPVTAQEGPPPPPAAVEKRPSLVKRVGSLVGRLGGGVVRVVRWLWRRKPPSGRG